MNVFLIQDLVGNKLFRSEKKLPVPSIGDLLYLLPNLVCNTQSVSYFYSEFGATVLVVVDAKVHDESRTFIHELVYRS